MKIAFWSEHENAGTTFNMAAVACATVMLYPISVAVLAGGYEDRDLENQFRFAQKEEDNWRKQKFVAEENEYFVATGLDLLLRKSGTVKLTEDILKQNMKQVVTEKLYCLPCGKKQYAKWWDKEDLFQKMEQIEQQLENCFDVVFVDCGCRRDDFARRMLEQADVCVLNMPQERETIGNYYRNRVRLRGKIFFLVGNYFEESVYNRENLEKIYRIDEKSLGAIPYDVHLQAAGLNGKAQGYVKSQLQHRCGLEFEQELTRTTRLIMQLAGIESIKDS
ncbi:MinD/ParA family ATP-binding protein [Roseburia sp. 499]|uniref:MinD/ParA family ATP-binding protein n=1 Tax=Roseburia sp. 499 TaxID=1261634 RepID=UPI000951372F|nr:hypothetical protein [Roseburia sp. 499]WVK69118.1 hypothetical protein BIV20_12135 [Roseburia sp. 499]